MRDAIWVSPTDDEAGRRLAAELEVPATIGRILANRGVTTPEAAHRFLFGTLDDLLDPFLMAGMREAVARIRRAVDLKEKILIFGDYDVDGVLSVVMLLKALRSMGAEAEYFIPDRIKEGYGIKKEHVDVVARMGAKLVISVDCGIKAVEFVERSRDLGADVIITDHHHPGNELPRALAVLDPVLEGSGYPEKTLAGVGVVFKLLQALRDGGPRAGEELRAYLKPVTIGTIADVAPLKGENRILVREGLKGLGDASNSGLKKLFEVCGLGRKRISEGDVGFRIGPRINAAGRMDKADRAVRLFFAPDEEASAIAGELDRMNTERQAEEERIFRDALKKIEERGLDRRYKFLVLGSPDWHRGIIGIVASKIKDRFHRPVLLFNYDDGKAHGSGRSISEFPLIDSLDACRDIFLNYGGHQMAVGCVLDSSRMAELRSAINAVAAARISDDDLRPKLRIDARLAFSDIRGPLLEHLPLLVPFGVGNPRPIFLSEDVEVAAPPRILKGKHLKFAARKDGVVMEVLGWDRGSWAERIRARDRVDMVYTFHVSEYLGEESVSLSLEDVRTG